MSESPATPAGADQALLIPGPAGRIEAAFDLPEADAMPQPVLAIVCHPLPTEGGTHAQQGGDDGRAQRCANSGAVPRCASTSAAPAQSDGELRRWPWRGCDDLRAVVHWVRATHPATRCGWPVSASARTCRCAPAVESARRMR
jgi:hypothetical protein